MRKELDRLPATLAALRSEAAVREAVAEVDRRVADHLRFPSGPRVHVAPVRVDEALARWRAERGVVERPPAEHQRRTRLASGSRATSTRESGAEVASCNSAGLLRPSSDGTAG